MFYAKRIRAVLIPSILALFCLPLSAQQPPAPSQSQGSVPVFHSGARLVLVPVVVTEHDRPVTGLSASDFTVLENGKPQTITSFEAVQSQVTPAVRANAPGKFSNQIAEKDKPRMVSIIVLDALNTPVLDQTYARQELVKYLEKQVNRDQLMTLLALDDGGVHLIHDFTTDPAVLIAALKKAKSKLGRDQENHLLDSDDPSSIVNQASEEQIEAESEAITSFLSAENEYNLMQRANRTQQTMLCMQGIAQAYGGLPGRKSLLWATASFPFRLGDPTEFSARGLMPLQERTFQMLNEANIAVYPVDVRGLVYTGATASDTRGTARAWRTDPTGTASRAFSRQADILQNMKEFAEMTGGRAFYNTNDLAGAFGKANADSSFYYMLGYYLEPQAQEKPGWRKLAVKVSRPGVKIRARSGFFVMPPGTPRPQVNAEIRAALASPIEFTAIPVTAVWSYSNLDQKTGKWSAYFELQVPGAAATLEDEQRLSLDYVAEARNPDGSAADITSQEVTASIKDPAKMRNGTMKYQGMLQIPPGTYSVTFLVRDNHSGKMGSVIAPLKVGLRQRVPSPEPTGQPKM